METPNGRHPIKQLPVSQAARIFGVWIAPDGSSIQQKKQLWKVTDEWVDHVRSGHIRKKDAWYFYQTTVKKPIKCALVESTLSPKDCHFIEAPAQSAALNVSGLPANMKLEVVAGSPAALGLGDGNKKL